MESISLSGQIVTNTTGYNKLIDFYNKSKVYSNQDIFIDFRNLKWFDANLCALLNAILFKLSKENKLRFSTDFSYIQENFDILLRNGFLKLENKIYDNRASTIQSNNFKQDDKDGFISYINNDLICHRSIRNVLSSNLKTQISDDLIELFTNIDLHAQTECPLFVCGQYYPQKGVMKFTMVDLGIGFLPAIMYKTNGEIDSHKKAIIWALKEGHTTKRDATGGLGLSGIFKYCLNNQGELHVVSGDTYFVGRKKPFIETLILPFVGTTISLFFHCNDIVRL